MTGETVVEPSPFDDPVLQFAVAEVLLSSDVGFQSGKDDGILGVAMRPMPNYLPELFIATYRSGYEVGALERARRLALEKKADMDRQETQLLLEQNGLCHGANKNDHSDPARVSTSGISTVERRSISPTPIDMEGKPNVMNSAGESTTSASAQEQQKKSGFFATYGKILAGGVILAGCAGAVGFVAGKRVGTKVQRQLGDRPE